MPATISTEVLDLENGGASPLSSNSDLTKWNNYYLKFRNFVRPDDAVIIRPMLGVSGGVDSREKIKAENLVKIDRLINGVDKLQRLKWGSGNGGGGGGMGRRGSRSSERDSGNGKEYNGDTSDGDVRESEGYHSVDNNVRDGGGGGDRIRFRNNHLESGSFTKEEESLYHSYMCLQSVRRCREFLVFMSKYRVDLRLSAGC